MQYIQPIPHFAIRRVVCRGTISVFEPFKASKWTGEEFKKNEIRRLTRANNPLLMRSRGTDTFRATEFERTRTPNTRGHYITTGRGTARTKLG